MIGTGENEEKQVISKDSWQLVSESSRMLIIEKLKVTLTANSIAKGDYAAFFRLLSAFLHFLKRKKFTQATNKITVIL